MQPDRMSMPITCSIVVPGGQHDAFFHVLFGSDRDWMLCMVRAMVLRLNGVSGTTYMDPVLAHLHERGSVDEIRAAWVMLVNVDMRTKELLLDPNSKLAQRRALGNAGQDCLARAAASFSVMLPLDTGKAKRLFVDLHADLVPSWLQNEILTHSDLVKSAKDLYLNS